MTHDLTKALIAKRLQVGADTPEGRHCSNLAGQIGNLPLAESEWERANILEAMQRQTAGLEQIQRDGGQYVHGNHGAQR
jgi:hypothetical protein